MVKFQLAIFTDIMLIGLKNNWPFILNRLGSYVYHREGPPFSGKFFCIPHSTENALEKYRYKHKLDELKHAEKRKVI